MISTLIDSCRFARDWVVWTFTGYPRGVMAGAYDWWDIPEYFASSLRVCHTFMIARMILEDDEPNG